MSEEPYSPSSAGIQVEVRDLRKSFQSNEVLKGVSFMVNPGEIFAIMGPSGSGKSVLLRHIIGLEDPDSGTILVEGKDIHSEEVLKQIRVAMVFQSGALLSSLTVGENVGIYLAEHRLKPPEEIDRIVSEKLDLVGLKGVQNRLPGELSGGMKKRVAIARALVMEPQLILYDEPTSELDPLMAVTIAEEILSLRQRIGVTSMVVSHDRDLVFAIADRVAFLHEGKIHSIGTPEEIRRTPDPMLQRFLTADIKGDTK